MSDRGIRFEMLNAYVDGELSGAEAATVARAAAQDTSIAGQIATLREMKAAIADVAPAVALQLPEEASWVWRRRRVVAVAATLGAILLLGFVVSDLIVVKQGPDWPSVLESHHRSWAFSRGDGAPSTLPVKGVARDIEPLDLSAAHLSYVGRERIEYRDLTLHRLGYEGTRGCRLSLFILPGSLDILAEAFAAPLRIRGWRRDNKAFLLMAEGMARGRFQDLAGAIENALREHRPFDAQTRQRLAQARAVSRPCRA